MFLLRRTDIPFAREDANRFLPLVIGLMVCLTGLFLAVALSIGASAKEAGALNVRQFQVYLPYQAKGMDEGRDKLLAMLRKDESVDDVKEVRKAELAKLIAPWTGNAIALDDLPLPVVLEVHLKDLAKREDAIARITKSAKAIHADIEIEQYRQWVDHFLQVTNMLRMVALALAVLLTAGLVVIVVLAARTSLKLNFRTVALLHNVGAQDEYIIRQFVTNGMWMVLRGAALGTGIAIITVIIFSAVSGQLQSPLLPSISLLPIHFVMFVALPLFTTAVAYIAVRLTIQAMLEHMH